MKMLAKKTTLRTAAIYLVTAIVFLAFCISKTGFVVSFIKNTSPVVFAEQYSNNPKLVDNSAGSVKMFHELLCEEQCDEETEEVDYDKLLLFIAALTTSNTETTSKKVVYYIHDGMYAAPVGLYTLFCSWKTNLV